MTQRKNISRQARDLTASFAAERSGATAIEYGIIAGSLSIAIAVSVYGVGSRAQHRLHYYRWPVLGHDSPVSRNVIGIHGPGVAFTAESRRAR